jgi:hypothetical protein
MDAHDYVRFFGVSLSHHYCYLTVLSLMRGSCFLSFAVQVAFVNGYSSIAYTMSLTRLRFGAVSTSSEL